MLTVTVYDVAKKAGVSITTVSRVLNSPEKVNKATRARILAAIDELGFVPRPRRSPEPARAVDASACWLPFSPTLHLFSACKA